MVDSIPPNKTLVLTQLWPSTARLVIVLLALGQSFVLMVDSMPTGPERHPNVCAKVSLQTQLKTGYPYMYVCVLYIL